jgi:uncharacterized protein YkwD
MIFPFCPPNIAVATPDPIVAIVNQVRADNGCKTPLREVVKLRNAAEERADAITKNWSHAGNWDTIAKYYQYKTAGENLAKGFSNDNDVVNAWLRSETHRKVMLNCKYTETGIGREGKYYVQVFAKP